MNTLNSDEKDESIEDSKTSQEPPCNLANRKSSSEESSHFKSTSLLETQENDKNIISNSSNVSLGQFREICKTKKSIKKVT
jgi:hypothetical protein